MRQGPAREPLRCLPLERRKIDAPNYGTPELRKFRMLTGLALMLRIVGLGLGEIGVRVLQEVGLRLLATEAVGLAFEAAVDRTIGLFVLRAHVVELAGHGQRRRGEANAECAGERSHHDSPSHGRSPWGYGGIRLGGTGGFVPHAPHPIGFRPEGETKAPMTASGNWSGS